MKRSLHVFLMLTLTLLINPNLTAQDCDSVFTSAGILPVVVEGNPNACSIGTLPGLKIDGYFDGKFYLTDSENTQLYICNNEDSGIIDSEAYIVVEKTGEAGFQSFSFKASPGICIEKVIVKGGSSNQLKTVEMNSIACIYDYSGLNITSDEGLHAAVKKDCSYFDISHIDFIFSSAKTIDATHKVSAVLSAEKTWEIDEIALADSIFTVAGGMFSTPFKTSLTQTGIKEGFYTISGEISIHNTLTQSLRMDSVIPLIENGILKEISFSNGTTGFLKPDETVTCFYTALVSGILPQSASFEFYGSGVVPVQQKVAEINVDSSSTVVVNSTVTVLRNGVVLGTSDKSAIWETNTSQVYTNHESSYYELGKSTILETGASDTDSILIVSQSPEISVLSNTTYERSHFWGISKTVSNDTVKLITGQTETVTYKVSINKDSVELGFLTEGFITVKNPLRDKTLTGALRAFSGNNYAAITGTGINGYVYLTPGQIKQFPFTIRFGSEPEIKELTTVLVSGSTEYSNTSPIEIPQSMLMVSELNSVVTVVDTYDGKVWENVSENSEWIYERSISELLTSKQVDESGLLNFTLPNTATIIETGVSDDANVDVTYYYPVVEQSSVTSFNRSSEWDFTITSDPEIHVNPDETTDVTYDVQLKKSYVDRDFEVNGSVSISNPSSTEPMELTVSDLYNNYEVLFNEIEPGGKIILQPGESIELTYDYSTDQKPLNQENVVVVNINNQLVQDTMKTSLNDSDVSINETNSTAIVKDNFGVLTDEPITESTLISVTRTFDTPLLFENKYVDGKQTSEFSNSFVLNDGISTDSVVTIANYYIPTLQKSVSAKIIKSYDWNIYKSASLNEVNLFAGEEALILYDVKAEKIASENHYLIEGTIEVTNANPVESMFVTLIEQVNGEMVPLDGTSVYGYAVIPPASTKTFKYALKSQDKPADGMAITFMANNYTDVVKSKTFSFEGINEATKIENDTVTVTDTYGSRKWHNVNTDTTFNYSRSVVCNNLAADDFTDGVYSFVIPNTAAIPEVGKSASASVKINCYAPVTGLMTEAHFVREYIWTAEKSSDSTTYNAKDGEALSIPFMVKVDAKANDKDFSLKGELMIYNPHPIETMRVELAANFKNEPIILPQQLVYIAPKVLHRVAFEHLPINGESANLLFSASLNGTEIMSSGLIVFDSPVSEINASVTVEDDMLPEPLGILNANDLLPVYFEYEIQKNPVYSGSTQTLVNTVFLKGDEGFTTSQASCSVTLIVSGNENPPVASGEGCTLTPGYWKTHSEKSGKYDIKWSNLPDIDGDGTREFENETFFLSNMSYLNIISASSNGKAYIILGRAFGAAYLNILAGADKTEIEAEFEAAKALLSNHTIESAQNNQAAFISLSEALDSYNNGVTGPGHCDDTDRNSTTTIDEKSANLDNGNTIVTPFPNPSGSELNFKIELSESALLRIEIYDAMGSLQQVLMDEYVTLDAPRVLQIPFSKKPGTLYFYRVLINGAVHGGTLLSL